MEGCSPEPWPSVVAYLARRDQEPNRTTDTIGGGVKFLCSCRLSSFRSVRHTPFFRPQAGSRAVRIEISCVIHDGRMISRLGSQSFHDPSEHTHIAPPFPTVVPCLWRPIFSRRIRPPQPIAVNENNPACEITETKLMGPEPNCRAEFYGLTYCFIFFFKSRYIFQRIWNVTDI